MSQRMVTLQYGDQINISELRYSIVHVKGLYPINGNYNFVEFNAEIYSIEQEEVCFCHITNLKTDLIDASDLMYLTRTAIWFSYKNIFLIEKKKREG